LIDSRRRVNPTVGGLLNMLGFMLLMLLVLAPQQSPASQISDGQKRDFLNLLKTLPHKGEFFTGDAIKTAGPYLPVLFALTDKDIEGYDIYPFAALSRGLCDDENNRQYATANFGNIRHSELKLAWAAMLFDARKPSAEIVRFLRDALKSQAKAKVLAEMLGPNFANFKRRVNSSSVH
jgi:hypothetical protein